MTVECVWCSRVRHGNWRRLVTTSLVAPVGCGFCPRVWLWQFGVVGDRRMWPWQLDVIVTHEVGGASWMWFVPACVDVAAGCGWRAPISR